MKGDGVAASADVMHCEPAQAEMKTCPYCQAMFAPVRRWQAFCSTRCATAFDVDLGAQGHVASVRKINRGASIVIHLSGPAAERALRLGLRDIVRVVKKP
jgi:endogenous inhibitor of DNA gyrase (YacG/DUF329 family)